MTDNSPASSSTYHDRKGDRSGRDGVGGVFGVTGVIGVSDGADVTCIWSRIGNCSCSGAGEDCCELFSEDNSLTGVESNSLNGLRGLIVSIASNSWGISSTGGRSIEIVDIVAEADNGLPSDGLNEDHVPLPDIEGNRSFRLWITTESRGTIFPKLLTSFGESSLLEDG